MTDVRLGVDDIDRQLVALIAKRQTYMAAAARIKTDRDTVHDSARIEDVVAKVVASAKEHGLSIDIAEPVWRELIRCSIAYEFKEWDKIRTTPMDETG
jgi:isochorismate pyruvate lyase